MKVGRCVGVSLLLSSALAFAGPAPGAPPLPATEAPLRWQLGPKPLALGHEVQLDLPAGYVFLGMPDADRFLRRNGGFHNDNVLGVIVSRDETMRWYLIIRYQDAGYVQDGEKLEPDELLKALREGTEQANKERVANNFPELHVGEWTESPHYDRASHRLVWAVPATSTRGTTINYNTRVLGRHGFVSLNLLSSPEHVAVDKSDAATLLTATTFNNGARYEDFDKKKDKVAEYGLMGLILGGAGIAAVKVAKVGLLAGLLKFDIAGWKIVAAFFLALGAGIKRIFTGKSAGVPQQEETKLPPTGTDGPNT
ncbi:MAG: putative inner rane protein [bacterium]|nr:putative inner rane protein [bacterium]